MEQIVSLSGDWGGLVGNTKQFAKNKKGHTCQQQSVTINGEPLVLRGEPCFYQYVTLKGEPPYNTEHRDWIQSINMIDNGGRVKHNRIQKVVLYDVENDSL